MDLKNHVKILLKLLKRQNIFYLNYILYSGRCLSEVCFSASPQPLVMTYRSRSWTDILYGDLQFLGKSFWRYNLLYC